VRLPGPLRKLVARPSPGPDESPTPHGAVDDSLPIPDYDRLSAKEITGQLNMLSQVELGIVEDHERSNQARAAVLTKLGYMREEEPLAGYDALPADRVVAILGDANAEQVRTIRDYERKFRHRREISDAVARLLPKAKPSAREDQQEVDRASRISAGHRSRTAAGEKLQNARAATESEAVEQ
jgi:hypothetical protein